MEPTWGELKGKALCKELGPQHSGSPHWGSGYLGRNWVLSVFQYLEALGLTRSSV